MRIHKSLFAIAVALVAAGTLSAGEKKLMHCFAFTSIPSASQADWKAFFTATDALPSKGLGISHVWYGKLKRPLSVGTNSRDWGTCMEFSGEEALAKYADAPGRKAWFSAYEKVRQPGTTTYDILGQ